MSWWHDVVQSTEQFFGAAGDLVTGQNPADHWHESVAASNRAVGNGDSQDINWQTAAEFFVGGAGIGAAAGNAAAASASSSAATGGASATTQTGILGGQVSSTAAKFAAQEGMKIGLNLIQQGKLEDYYNQYTESQLNAMSMNPNYSVTLDQPAIATSFNNSPENFASESGASTINPPQSSINPALLAAAVFVLIMFLKKR